MLADAGGGAEAAEHEAQQRKAANDVIPDAFQRDERAAEHLKNRELDYMAWDRVCCELTKSEKEICQLILKGKTLKEICLELGKSESNITSQRSHIRRKLNMERKDDLKRVLQQRFFAARMNVDKLPQVEKIESEPLPAPPPLV